MKKILQHCMVLMLLFSISIRAAGQYTGGNPDVAFLKLATASDSITGFEPGKAVDGSPATYASIPGSTPAFLMIDLRKVYYIDGYGITLPKSDELPRSYIIQGSLNGTSWSDLGNGTITNLGVYTFNFQYPDQYRYVRILITDKDALASFTEVYVYGYEILPPNPPVTALEATNLTSSGFAANWNMRSTATGYLLDISTQIDFSSYVTGYNKLDVGNVNSKVVSDLLPSTTYYYRVRAYNLAGAGNPSNKVPVTTLKLPQTITFNNIPSKTYGDNNFDLSATASSGLPVNFSSSDQSIATINGAAVTILGVGSTTITATQVGNSQYEAANPVNQELVVSQKELTVTGTVASDKTYDGENKTVLSGATLQGIVGNDDVILSEADSGTFTLTSVGIDIPVTTAMILIGADSSNYTLAQPVGIVASITPKELTVTGAVAVDKVYDATTDAVVSGAALVGIVGSDEVQLTNANTGTFTQADAGTGIPVSTLMSLTGSDALNYTVLDPIGLTADITKRELLVTPENASREACEVNPEFILGFEGFVGNDDSGALDTAPVASSAANETSIPGEYEIVPSGGSANNYSMVYISGTLTVTPDVTDPVLVIQDITIQLDDTGNATITASDLVTEATDNCGMSDTVLNRSTFSSSDVGEVIVEVTLIDLSGNQTTEFGVVTVESQTGLKDLSDQIAGIFPNPTNGKVYLKAKTLPDILKVMDMTGKTVIHLTNPLIEEAIDLTAYPNGIYIFQLQFGEELHHIKVLKK